MGGRDLRDRRDIGPRDIGQPGDLAGAVHAHLQHREIALRVHPRQSQRQADAVVETRDARMDRAETLERPGAHRPRAGLADAARDGDDARPAPGAGGAAERDQGLSGVPDFDRRQPRVRGPRHDGADGAGGRGRRDEVVAVEILAPQGDEQVPRRGRTAVDRHPGGRERTARRAARRGGGLVAGP